MNCNSCNKGNSLISISLLSLLKRAFLHFTLPLLLVLLLFLNHCFFIIVIIIIIIITIIIIIIIIIVSFNWVISLNNSVNFNDFLVMPNNYIYMMRPRNLKTCYEKVTILLYGYNILKLKIQFYKYFYDFSAPILKEV